MAANDRAHAIDIWHALPEAAAKHIDLSATRRKTLSWLALLSMIFGHAPIILPAVTGLRVNSAAAYDSLVLLHLSAFLRIAADLFEWVELRSSSGLVTIIAIAAYAGTLVAASGNIQAAVRVR